MSGGVKHFTPPCLGDKMNLCSLRSSSKGNAILVHNDKTKILIDCGISGKMAEKALLEAGISPLEISAVLITHEHSDHIKGVGIMTRRYNIPVYANEKTWEQMSSVIGNVSDENINIIKNYEEFEVGNIGIKSFEIPHDAADPVGYSFFCNNKKISVATDIGILKKSLFTALNKSNTVLLESNHDINMLEIGSYPLPLKQRIRGELGHLSNDDAGKAAEFLVRMGTENIMLGHLSQENNYPLLAKQTVENILAEADIKVGTDVNLKVAMRENVSFI